MDGNGWLAGWQAGHTDYYYLLLLLLLITMDGF